jgi:hypothetical protein
MCVCALLLTASQAPAVLIDHFDDGNFTIIVSDAAGTTNSTDTGTMIGGERETTLTWATPSPNTGFTDNARVVAGTSKLIWEQGDSIKGTLIVLYDGVGTANGTNDGLGDVDLSAGGAIQFLFQSVASGGDGSSFQVTVEVKSGIGTGEGGVKTQSVTGMFSGFGTFGLDFSGLSGDAGFDITKVDSIKYTFDSSMGGNPAGTGGGDYAFDLFGTGVVPEPLTMLGMFLGLGSVGAYIRKRRMM